MSNSTETHWSIDGVSLQTYAFNISTWGGDAQSPPPMRGSDSVIPYAVGEQYHRKVPGARTMSFGMWVVGANEDGSLPAGGSSREMFERNWAKLRKLIWNPNRQVTLTKRFKDWETGEIIEASAKAEFAGGLAPTMNGTQRAVFTVQFKLADPFFYGVEKSIEVSAMTEAARNYAQNPTPATNVNGYSAVVESTTEPSETSVIRGGTGASSYAETYYLNSPTTRTGGIAYGGVSTPGISVTPGLALKYSAMFNAQLGGEYTVSLSYFDVAYEPIAGTFPKNNFTAVKNVWRATPLITHTAPANAAYAQLAVVVNATTGTIPKSSAVNRATNPNFAAVGTYTHYLANEFLNPAFEKQGTGDLKYGNVVVNEFTNSSLERESTSQRIITQYIKNPKFKRGLLGWFQDGADPDVPARALSTAAGGPVGGTYMILTSRNLNGGVSTRHVAAEQSSASTAQSGSAHGIIRGASMDMFATAWVKTSSGTKSVSIQLVERTPTGTHVKTNDATFSLGASWTRIRVDATKTAAGNDLFFRIIIRETGTHTIHIAGCSVVNVNTFAGFFDGDGYLPVPTGRTDASVDPSPRAHTFKWAGDVNFSSSTLTTATPLAVGASSGRRVYAAIHTVLGANRDDFAMYIVRDNRDDTSTASINSGAWIYTTTADDIGKTITFTAQAIIPVGYNATGDTALSSEAPSRSIYILGSPNDGRAQAPSTAGVHTVRATITPTASGQLVRLSGGGQPNAAMGWKTITMVRGIYPGPPFTGDRKAPVEVTGPWESATPIWQGGTTWTPAVLRTNFPDQVYGWGWNLSVGMNNINSIDGKTSMEINRLNSTAYDAGLGVRLWYQFKAGVTYTVAAVGRIPVGYDASEDVPGLSRSMFSLDFVGMDTQLPSTPGTYTIKKTFTPDADGYMNLGGGGVINQSVFWDNVTIVTGDRDFEPFTGNSTGGTDAVKYQWVGAANNSMSLMSIASAVTYTSPVNSAHVTKIDSTTWGLKILNSRKDAGTNYVNFEGIDALFDYDNSSNETYTIMLTTAPSGLGTEVSGQARKLVLTLEDGTQLESAQVSSTASTSLRWILPRPSSKPESLIFNVGHASGAMTISKFAVIANKYTGTFFSGGTTQAAWLGASNASMSQQLGDIFRMQKVFAVTSSFTGAYFDGATANTGTGDNSKTYSWVGTPYGSESVYSIVNTTGVDIEVDGDFYTRKIKVVATPPVASYSLVAKTGDIEPQGYEYTLGVTSAVTVDVEKFSVAVVGSPGDKAYAVEPTKEGYWLELAPGTNTLLLRGVGTGKLNVKYRAAWV